MNCPECDAVICIYERIRGIMYYFCDECGHEFEEK
jgi:hypothetical protein